MEAKDEKIIFEGVRSLKQRQFIISYCNPESPTFDNGAGSYKEAYGTKNSNVAAVEAHNLLEKEHIQEAMDRYRAFIHEQQGFALDWLDANLKNLFYRTKQQNDVQAELRTLKAIGDRIGAFKEQKPDSAGKNIPLTAEQEKMIPQIIAELQAEELRNKIKKAE